MVHALATQRRVRRNRHRGRKTASGRQHYNYFRDYEPGTGRYVQSDPIGLAGGVSTLSYVGGSPMVGTDPSGLIDPATIARWVATPQGARYVTGLGHFFRGQYRNVRHDFRTANVFDWESARSAQSVDGKIVDAITEIIGNDCLREVAMKHGRQFVMDNRYYIAGRQTPGFATGLIVYAAGGGALSLPTNVSVSGKSAWGDMRHHAYNGLTDPAQLLVAALGGDPTFQVSDAMKQDLCACAGGGL